MAILDLEGRLTRSFFMKGMAKPSYPIIQGGMGFAISLWELAAQVAKLGIVGVVSSVHLDYVYRHRHGKVVSLRDATAWEIAKAKQESDGGTIGINIMRKVDSAHDLIGKIDSSYEESIAGAILGGVDIIISGAGLPIELPKLARKYCELYNRVNPDGTLQVGLVPIVSMDVATKGILRSWGNIFPDAIIVEGPRAGGHLGWTYNRMGKFTSIGDFLAGNDLLDHLFVGTKEVLSSEKYNKIPIIVAGGIDTHEAIVEALTRGASAVQIATPFLGTNESGANPAYKQAIVEAQESDILIGDKGFGSPTGFPFAFLRQSPLYQDFLVKKAAYERTGADMTNFNYAFCICKALIAASTIHVSDRELGLSCVTHNFMADKPNAEGTMACPAVESSRRIPLDSKLALYTCGRNVGNVKKIIPASEVVYNLINPVGLS